ncbi:MULTISPECIES: sugar-binding transcriptional regulator [unclassified Brevibacterium]|uniref:sugar-binding transcriptional regulator n=1 Tax=unclassified Brevibacterium TaxID=2614124 RepID=UPI000C60BE64|nr:MULTISPECIES: sugar-binding domain-containing protein [unclassified Brevibacterium]SMY04674.1 DNA-binding transcriptional regulator LsrR, DeoR family [Brevibacterium sp. 239c]
MSTAPTARHRRFLAQLAREHYVQGRSKVELGKAHGLSRFQIARLLQEAVDNGVVTITIEADAGADEGRAEALAATLGLRSAVIVDLEHEGDAAQRMGRAALSYVDRRARPGMRIGLAWSRTLDAAAQFAPALPRCTVVQLAGALQLGSQRPSSGIFARLGQDAAVTMVRLPAPLLVTEADTAADLSALPEISSALAAADDLDLAVISVAAWAQEQSSVWEKCSPEQRAAGLADGAVAEASGRLFNAAGVEVDTIDDRVIAVTLDQLRHAATTVGVARGAQRAEAVRAACAAGILDVVIVDEALAGEILDRSANEAQPDAQPAVQSEESR